jgi:hypothetical protein
MSLIFLRRTPLAKFDFVSEQNVNLASEMASHTPVQIVIYILENHTDLGTKKTLIIKVCTTPNIEV